MNIIIPMAGAGKRFTDAGYAVSKPALPTIDRRTGRLLPMVVCAVLDLPGVESGGANVTLMERSFHKSDGTEDAIKRVFPKASFISVENLTEGQACTCLLAKKKIDTPDELLIAGCDNGMVYDPRGFERSKREADCLVFTYRHNEAVLANPSAYGWMKVDGENNITGVSVKKAISDTPLEDHAVVATFWFREGSLFVRAAEKMIEKNDRVNGEFYVDEAIKYVIEAGCRAKVFEIDRYICWGTPKDYEDYMATVRYWEKFIRDRRCLIGR